MENITYGSINYLKPLHLLGSNIHYQFCTILCQQCILYLSGRHLIMENLKTYHQRVVWTIRQKSSLKTVGSLIDSAGKTKIIVGGKDEEYGMNYSILFDVDPFIIQLEISSHYYILKHIEFYEELQSLKYVRDGKMFAALSCDSAKSSLTIYSCKNGQKLYGCSLNYSNIQIHPIQILKISYVVLSCETSIIYLNLGNFEIIHDYALPFDEQEKATKSIIIPDGKDQALGFFITQRSNLYICHLKHHKIANFFKTYVGYENHQPSCFDLISNKIVIGYDQCSIVGFVSYSAIDYGKNKLFFREILSKSVKGVSSIVASNDNCHCVFITKANKSQILYIDLVSAMIDKGSEDNYCVSSLTHCSCDGKVLSVTMSPLNCVMIAMTDKCSIIAYNLHDSAKIGPCNIKLWEQAFKQQPIQVCCHPLNYNIILLFTDTVKFYTFSSQKLSNAYFSIATKFSTATYSPDGHVIVLGGSENVTVLDSYSLQLVKRINLPHRNVLKIAYVSKDDVLVHMSNKQLWLIDANYKVYHLGTVEVGNYNVFVYDCKREIGLFSYRNSLKIVNSQMQLIAKVNMLVTSQHLCMELQTMFLGTADGVIYAVSWSDLQINFEKQPKYLIHFSPIKYIKVSINFKYLYSVSEDGVICVSQIQMNDSKNIPKHISIKLLHTSQRTFYLTQKMLISSSEQSEKDEQLIKLMCIDSEMNKLNENKIKEYQQIKIKQIQLAKLECQDQLKHFIHYSQTSYTYKKYQGKIDMIKHDLRNIINHHQTDIINQNTYYQQKMKQIYQNRQLLENTLQQIKQSHKQQLYNNKQIMSNHIANQQQHQQLKIQQIEQHQYCSSKKEQQNKQKNIYRKCELEETKIQNNTAIIRGYQDQIQQINNNNNQILALNRKLTIQINHLKQKNREISIRSGDVEVELGVASQSIFRVSNQKKRMQMELFENNLKASILIKNDRQQQSQLKYELQNTKISNIKYNKLLQQINILEKQLKGLDEKFQDINIKLVDQQKLKQFYNIKIKDDQEKLNNLKLKRAKIYQNFVISKARLSHKIEKKQPLSNKQNIIQLRDSKHEQLEHCNNLKNSSIHKYKLSIKKAQQQNTKLTYQFNFLKRDYQQKKLNLKKLQQSIEMTKIQNKTIQQWTRENIKRKNYLSLHKNGDEFVTQI